MTRTIGIKIICVATALILALASIFGVAKITTDPAFYQKSIAALEEKLASRGIRPLFITE